MTSSDKPQANRFRFRAWSIVEKKMLHDRDLKIADDQNLLLKIVPLNNFIEGFSHQGDVLMQSTDLLDRNGKEVFEKDLISALGKLWFVSWGACGFWFRSVPDAYEDAPEEILTGSKRIDGEIIGNIYENPSLLQA